MLKGASGDPVLIRTVHTVGAECMLCVVEPRRICKQKYALVFHAGKVMQTFGMNAYAML